MITYQHLRQRQGETDIAFATRVMAQATEHGVDIEDLALDAWELPEALTPAQIQILAAHAILHGDEE